MIFLPALVFENHIPYRVPSTAIILLFRI